MKTLISFLAALLMAVFPVASMAQEESVYKRGATYEESIMPPSPEPASAVKYADIPFSHSCGMAEYDIPFYTIEGKELSIPISLHYASGGIKLDEIAGVAGLGWNLEAGGCVTRTVVDMPDEFTAVDFRHELPQGDLFSDLDSMINNTASFAYLRDIIYHRVDSKLDRYSYNVCGLNGSFYILDDGSVFKLNDDGVEIRITRNNANRAAIDRFTLIGPDGTSYIMSVKEEATHEGTGSYMTTPTTGQADRWTATTAWYVSQIRSRSGLEVATFSYSQPVTWKRTVAAHREMLSVTCKMDAGNPPQRSRTSSYIHNSYETMVLTGITLGNVSAEFTYIAGTGNVYRADSQVNIQNYPFRLTNIAVNAAGNPSEICSLQVGTSKDSSDGRIVLDHVRLYRGGILDDKWDFTYRSVNTLVSKGSQDWYGYYNGENEFTTTGNPTICPYEFSSLYHAPELTNGYPDANYADYMSLKAIDHDGAVTEIVYEGNRYDAFNETYDIGVRVNRIYLIKDGNQVINTRAFTYENPQLSGPGAPIMNMYMTTEGSMGLVELLTKCTWDLTLHSTPVAGVTSVYDTRVYYGRVTEDIVSIPFKVSTNIPITQYSTVRTVYEYDTADVLQNSWHVGYRFPSNWLSDYNSSELTPAFCSPWNGIQSYYDESGRWRPALLTRRKEYSYDDGEFKLKSSVEYTYSDSSHECVLVGYEASKVMEYNAFDAYGNLNYNDIYHYPIYVTSYSSRNPIEEVRVNYHDSGNDTLVINTSYVPRMHMTDPVRVESVSTSEEGVTRRASYVYADTWENAESWVSTLCLQRYLSFPLKRIFEYGESLAMGPRVVYPDYPAVRWETYKEETTEYATFNNGSSLAILPSVHKESTCGIESWREAVLSRDHKGNITSFKEKGHPETVVLWGYDGSYPMAIIENATIETVTAAMGGQNTIIAMAEADIPDQLHLDALAELRSALPDARVTTYSYIPGIGVSSVTDPAGMTTTYEYDRGRLSCVKDHDGNKVEEYEYSLMADDDGRRHMRSKIFRTADGLQYSEDVRWWDRYGRKTEDISIAAAGNGHDLVTAYGSDFMLRDDVRTWLPYPVQNTQGNYQADPEDSAAEYHESDKAYYLNRYEMSARDIVKSTALPGYDGEHETGYDTDVVEGFPIWEWRNDKVEEMGTYDPEHLVVEKTVDADGRLVSSFKDHTGRILGTSYGNDAPTYYIYDKYDRLCAVAGSGIESTDTLNMWRYSHDGLGRLSSKGVPGSVREFYTYDEEDRVVSVLRDGVLKEMEYDAFGRVIKVYQTLQEGTRTLIEQHTYDVYPSGMTGANPKGQLTTSRMAEVGPDGSFAGIVVTKYSYDDKKRPVTIRTRYADDSELIQENEYDFTGKITSSSYTYIVGAHVDEFVQEYSYDQRGRLILETARLNAVNTQPRTAQVRHGYDALGRPAHVVVSVPGGSELHTTSSYSLQGWQNSLSVTLNGSPLFAQNLGYDSDQTVSGTDPLYSGLVSRKDEVWSRSGMSPITSTEGYTYDYAGRLNKEIKGNQGAIYTYDPRGNLLSEISSSRRMTYDYSGDRMTSLVYTIPSSQTISEFSYDNLGRMTSDGLAGQTFSYNSLDLVGNVSRGGATLVNYFYLADGTKTRALDGSGEGLVYRGPFVYRKGSGSSSLTLESAAFEGGRLTPDGALLYVTDYLGSVRAVVDGATGQIYKAVDYSAYGYESEVMVPQQGSTPEYALAAATLPSGMTLRDSFTGQEDQTPDFGTSYTDFGARQYSPALRRWMTPDPLSEKYYGMSPYVFCANNPVNFVDPDGEAWGKATKVAKKVYKTVKAGNKVSVKGILKSEAFDIADNVRTLFDPDASGFEKGIAAFDLATGFGDEAKWLAKTVGVSDAIVDGAKTSSKRSKLQEAAEIGQEAHRQIEKELKISVPGTETEVRMRVGRQNVRKDAVMPDGTVVIIKPDTPSGHKAAVKRGK